MLTFTFPLPPCLNEQIRDARSHWAKSATVKRRWTSKVAKLAKGKIEGQFYICFYWYVKFSRDPDNVAAAAKYLMDGLKQAGVIQDDSLMYVMSPILHFYEKSAKEKVIVKISKTPIYTIGEVEVKRSAIAV